jgi:hypothetical protein
MNEMQSKALGNMLRGLKVLGCSFIVIDSNGTKYEYGDAIRKKPKDKTVRNGDRRNYYMPFVQDMNPGDVVEIPAGEYSINEIQSGVSSILSKTWGNGSYVTSRDQKKNVLEVLRVY